MDNVLILQSVLNSALFQCFLEPLKKVQVEGFLMYAEPSDIFSNLDELCYVSTVLSLLAITLCMTVSSADNICKQFGSTSGPTFCRA